LNQSDKKTIQFLLSIAARLLKPNGAVYHVTSAAALLLAVEIVTNGDWMLPMQMMLASEPIMCHSAIT